MASLISACLAYLASWLQSRHDMQLEILALRHQLALYQRCTKKRPPIEPWDRLFWSWLSRLWSGWKSVLHFVQPSTVTTWQKKRFRDHWKRLSQSSKPGRPSISKEVSQLIRDMWQSNPTWGSPRIVGELHKIGIDVAKSTVEACRPRDGKPSSPTWRVFLNNHVKDIVACDFFTVPTVNFRVLFVFLMLAHDRRRIVHFNITEHPTAQWTAQQIVEAFPWNTTPHYLLRDRDSIYGAAFQNRVGNLGIEEVTIAPRSPWQNPYCERVIGSIRRECLDDVIILNEQHLRRMHRSHEQSSDLR